MNPLLRALALLALFAASLHAAPLSGTYRIGPTGDYPSLTAVIANVQAGGNGLGGAVTLELQATYVSTVETFPLTIPALNGASAVKTLTIRPAAGAVALLISSGASATINLNAARFVTIDGRPGGVGNHAGSGGGTASQLTIANTSNFGVALRLLDEVRSNTFRYTTFQGMNTSATSGVVLFSSTTGVNSNGNAIDHCDIRDGASTPANGIYAGFSQAQTGGSTISNCNIFNFYSGTTTTAGVRLDAGTTGWTITGNSFYQTASRAAVAANVRSIYINNTSGSNFAVTGNFIGGSAPNAGGTAWTTTGTAAAYLFQGIRLNVSTFTPSSVQGNTIANIVWTSSSAATTLPGVWSGIYVVAGAVNIGTVTGNAVGSGTGTDSVSITTSGSGSASFGIGSESGSTVANNTIGSITVNGSAISVSTSLIGIAGASAVSNNTVGSITTANSFNAATSSTSSTGQEVTGILNASIITGNTVANLNNNYAGTAAGGRVYGISAGATTITGNTVHNLSTTSQNAAALSVCGINETSNLSGQIMSQNIVHSLANTAATGAVRVTGMSCPSLTVASRNLVHSLAVFSNSPASELNGMEFLGSCIAQNNIVHVGLNASGASTAGASIVRGIYDNSTAANRAFYHNSVYVGGTQTSGVANTTAFVNDSSGGTRTFQNNIFVNARSNSGGSGKHYAVRYGGTPAYTVGLTAGGNLFFSNGTGGVLGFYDNADRITLLAWQAATGQDATSAVADPLFVAPTGTAATVDLHLPASNPAEGGGLSIAAVIDDFDGQTRSTLTPVDIGADSGNFTSTGDIFAPAISYPLLSNGSTANRALSGWATITDNSGSVSGGASSPRLYYKKGTDADVFGVANDSTGNGWKYVTATGDGPYSFTLDYSRIHGGSVTIGDTVQYFVVAQDAANNFGSSPAAATGSAIPPVQNVNAHGAVNSFSILPTISGTKTVGSGGEFASLSGAAGLFAALNGRVIDGDVLVKISSDLIENGTNGLNEITTNEFPAPLYTVTIQPNAATMRTISGTVEALLLNGADRVTIDGRFGGTGRYLTFRSNSSTTIRFVNDASGNTVRNCIVEGATLNTTGVIGFTYERVTGNDNNLINGCQVRGLNSAAAPNTLISSSASANSGNVIADNELFDFSLYGIDVYGGSWTLSGNNIYQVRASNSSVVGIQIQGGGGPTVVSGNFIHDLLTTDTSSRAILFSGTGPATIAHNRIAVFNANAATTDVYGIVATGLAGSTLNVLNNQIALNPAPSGSRSLFGIYDNSSSSVVNVFYNSIVLGGTESGMRNSWASYSGFGSTHTARNNLFLNLRTGGTGSHFAAGRRGTGVSSLVSHNVYAGTGATAANFMDLSNTSGAFPVNFATWQSSIGDTNSQAGVADTGNFTAAIFVSAATGDLHLVPGGNVLVNALGTPIAGVTTDFDGDFRSATTPTIGSDEFTPLSAFSTWAAANGVSDNPNALGANGVKNLLNFAFSISPITVGVGGLQYAGTFAGNGAITATGLPMTMVESAGNGMDLRALFVRRKDFAAAGLTYMPQFSDALAAWANSAAVPVVLADDGVNQIVSVPFPAFIVGQTTSFFRLGVSLAP